MKSERKDLTSTALILMGVVCVCIGAFLLRPWLGFTVTGLISGLTGIVTLDPVENPVKEDDKDE